MKMEYSPNVLSILACPYCGCSLHLTSDGATCEECGVEFGYVDSGALDVRLRKKKKYQLDFELGKRLTDSSNNCRALKENTAPQIGIPPPPPRHFNREFLSYFPRAKSANSLALDMGCGDTIHKKLCEYAGFEYIGLDYDTPEAPIIGDGHALPFLDDSFELVLMLGVLEHVQFPLVVMHEAYRVLKSEGTLIGTVAFMEPFHGQSYYHHTHLGILNTLTHSGFHVDFVAPRDPGWTALRALSRMALFPRMPAKISRAIVAPLELFHKFWWKIGMLMGKNISEDFRQIQTTGAFAFLAHKS